MAFTVGTIIRKLGGQLHGDENRYIAKLASLELANHDEISFLSNPKLTHALAQTKAGCVIISPKAQNLAIQNGCDHIITENPYLYYARLSQLFYEQRMLDTGRGAAYIHKTAVIEKSAIIDKSVTIGALSYIGHNVKIGAGTIIKEKATILENTTIGERCIVHSGAVIGADGFGFAAKEKKQGWEKISQLGGVQIGDDVEIGANTCIDKGAIGNTIIENGVKLDNLIQIGHNTKIGKHTAMAGCVGVAGSAKIGANCTVGGAGMILGHLTIADNVHISSASIVTRSIQKSGHYTGFFPLDENTHWEKNAATIKQLYNLRERIKQLEQAIEQIAGQTHSRISDLEQAANTIQQDEPVKENQNLTNTKDSQLSTL